MKLSELFKGKAASSAELRAARDQLSVEKIERQIADLTQARRDALLSDDDKALRRIEADIEAANLDAERTTLQIEALTAKIAEAEQREKLEEIDRRRGDAKQMQAQLAKLYVAVDESAARLADQLHEAMGLRKRLQEHRQFFAVELRESLNVIEPFWLLSQQLGKQHDEYQDISQFKLAGYFPTRHPDGPRLSRMKELRL